jgi:bifunctional UDP-N-acetylglucosamine pyrophosphorylase/glucosamine-1-phosphate N-acetyltransferase
LSDSSPRRVFAVIPAAGKGSRLGLNRPKVFTPLDGLATIWDVLHDRLVDQVDHCILILSPEGERYAQRAHPPINLRNTQIVLQPEPRGMGDAIFGASKSWRSADDLLIVWGDQCNISGKTFQACLELHQSGKAPCLTLPLLPGKNPYVEYQFEGNGRLARVLQSREGDVCSPGGLADMGVFLLTAGERLIEEWGSYCSTAKPGASTGEINFLPFLAHLSRRGWPVQIYSGAGPDESLGVNTPAELEAARKMFSLSRKKSEAAS